MAGSPEPLQQTTMAIIRLVPLWVLGVREGSYEVRIKSQAKPASGDSNPMAGLAPGSPEYAEAYRNVSGSSRDKKTYKTAVDPNAIPEKYESGTELKAVINAVASQTVDFSLK